MLVDGMAITDDLLVRFTEVVNAEENPVIYLSCDPGKNNGLCGYDERYRVVFMYNILEEDLMRVLECFHKINTFVIEDFTLYPHKAQHQVYSDMLTSRVIGRVEDWARRNAVNLVKQGAKIKETGYKWIGKKPLPKSNSMNHPLDAHVHFMYWAIKNGKISAASVINNEI